MVTTPTPDDDGTILAYTWRLLHGEIPYRDFIYIRTPLSPYLASFWFFFPPELRFLMSRLGFYFMMSMTGFIPWWLLVARNPDHENGHARFISLALTLTTTVLAIAAFPPMPWHTHDGVFFACMSWFLLCFLIANHPSYIWSFVAGCLAAFSVLAKQNFALIPIMAILGAATCVLLWQNRRSLFAGLLVTAGVVSPLIILLLYLAANHGLSFFFEQVFGASDPTRVYKVFELYISGAFGWAILGFICCIIIALFLHKRKRSPSNWLKALTPGSTEFLVVIVAVFALSYPWYSRKLFAYGFFWSFAGILFVNIVTRAPEWLRRVRAGGYAVDQNLRRQIVYLCIAPLGALVIAFSSSLSFSAYVLPNHGFASFGTLLSLALMPLFVARSRNRGAKIYLGFLFIGLLALSLTVFTQEYLKRPYRAAPRHRQVYNLATVVPKIGTMYCGPKTYGRFVTLAKIFLEIDGLGENRDKIVVMPYFPIWYYLTDTRNPVSLDWIQRGEIHNQSSRLIEEFDERVKYAIVECNVSNEKTCQRSKLGSRVSRWVLTHWMPEHRVGPFFAFRNPKL